MHMVAHTPANEGNWGGGGGGGNIILSIRPGGENSLGENNKTTDQ